jgi:hypothetical protein
MEQKQYLIELTQVVERAQRALGEFLRPDSAISERETINQLLGILDDRRVVKLIAEANECGGTNRQALFAKS